MLGNVKDLYFGPEVQSRDHDKALCQRRGQGKKMHDVPGGLD